MSGAGYLLCRLADTSIVRPLTRSTVRDIHWYAFGVANRIVLR